MADGTPMDPHRDNAASKTLPLGTTAKVTNPRPGRSAVVTIKDRGPYVQGRIVDLSPSTAQKVGITRNDGVAKVEVVPITVPLPDGSVKPGDAAQDTTMDRPTSRAMTDLSAFPITKKWPAQHPDRLQLYSLPTPNGVKVSIMLEETGLPYEPHLVSFDTNDQMSPEFLSLNPNNKIPAILDPNGPGGQPLALFESGAILIYLAEKTGAVHAAGCRAAATRRSSG